MSFVMSGRAFPALIGLSAKNEGLRINEVGGRVFRGEGFGVSARRESQSIATAQEKFLCQTR